MKNKFIKVLYLFSGTRQGKIDRVNNGELPDTCLYGMNHLSKYEIEAVSKELNLFGCNYFGFIINHILSFFLTFSYKVVFGSSLLYTALLKKILLSKKKFVLLNISLNRTLYKNSEKKFRLIFIKWLLDGIDFIVCLSNKQRRDLIEKYGVDNQKIVYMPLGVDVDYYKSVFFGRSDFILSVGRDNGRDYKTVFDVAKRLPNQKFVVICSKRNLKAAGEIPNNVEVFFDMDSSKLNEYYKSARLLLLLTYGDDYLDGSDCSGQTVLLDAFASGLPVIATKKSYLLDYSEDKKDILTVKQGDVVGVLDKIRLLKDNKLGVNLAKNARIKTEIKFSTKVMAYNLSLIFKK